MDERTVATGQGSYYVISGVWPLIHLPSFERITGPKVDGWLVKTVGAVVGSIGLTLLLSTRHQRISPEMAVLGSCSAIGLAAIDIVYVAKRRISPIYLADALLELGFVAGGALASRSRAARGSG